MSQLHVAAEREIGAPAERVYRILADYRRYHPNILPPRFSELRVEQGGVGTGTIFTFNLRLGGRTRGGRMVVTEVEPGRVLVERDTRSNLATTFTVEPAGKRSRARIEITWDANRGVGGLLERLFAPRILGGMYRDELNRLDAYARGTL